MVLIEQNGIIRSMFNHTWWEKAYSLFAYCKCRDKICLLGESGTDLPGLLENVDPHGQTFHWFQIQNHHPHAMKRSINEQQQKISHFLLGKYNK